MEPVLNSHFTKFKQQFEILTTTGSPDEQKKKEATAFEKFVNYVLFSLDYPGIFTANMDLLDSVCLNEYAIGIDGAGIKVNDRLVRDVEDVKSIAKDNRKVNVDFVFIQTKMSPSIDIGEFNKFGLAVNNFFSEGYLPEGERLKELREVKDFIYSDQNIISKLDTNPNVYLYYVTTGPEVTDQNFEGARRLLQKELASFFFEHVSVAHVSGKQILKDCRELENKFEVQLNIFDIFPLIVDPKADIKKAYSFTCSAPEFLKLITKEDGTLRRALFNDNVRDYLGKNPVNSEIEQTILDNPEMFLLCNNGITIVCSQFDQIRDKLVRIEDPQIVNGCQTSNALFNLKDHPNISKVQIVVRIISTDNLGVSNKILRGTNKQNQVLDEAFETTSVFHQEVLEPFFLAIDNPIKIFYERRSRQYNNDPLVKKTQVVNLRILTQTFVAIFLNSPHEAHIHEAKLLEKYAGEVQTRRIFRQDHKPNLYYVCALIWYMFEKYFREWKISPEYRTYKAHLYFIFKYSIGEFQPNLSDAKAVEIYCGKLVQALTEPKFSNQIAAITKLFADTRTQWMKLGRSRYGIKDSQEFTDLLTKNARSTFISKGSPAPQEAGKMLYKGKILNVVKRPDGSWFGFIERGSILPNVYLDNRGYKGVVSELIPRTEVQYELGTRDQGDFAMNVELTHKA